MRLFEFTVPPRTPRLVLTRAAALSLIIGAAGCGNSSVRQADPAPGDGGQLGLLPESEAGDVGSDVGSDAASDVAALAAAGGDFVVSNDWQGSAYLVSDAASRYAPLDFSQRAVGEPLCVSGEVAADPTFGSFFELGIHINQPSGDAQAAPVQKAGLALRVTQNRPSPLRAQLVGPDGPGDNQRWCATLDADTELYRRWDVFNTACWDGSGAPYDASPLRSVAIVVPGSNGTATPFDFCLEAFADGDSAADAVIDARTSTGER